MSIDPDGRDMIYTSEHSIRRPILSSAKVPMTITFVHDPSFSEGNSPNILPSAQTRDPQSPSARFFYFHSTKDSVEFLTLTFLTPITKTMMRKFLLLLLNLARYLILLIPDGFDKT